MNPNLSLSSLDLSAYAYLKEFVAILDPELPERKLLDRKNYPKLIGFMDVMDFVASND